MILQNKLKKSYLFFFLSLSLIFSPIQAGKWKTGIMLTALTVPSVCYIFNWKLNHFSLWRMANALRRSDLYIPAHPDSEFRFYGWRPRSIAKKIPSLIMQNKEGVKDAIKRSMKTSNVVIFHPVDKTRINPLDVDVYDVQKAMETETADIWSSMRWVIKFTDLDRKLKKLFQLSNFEEIALSEVNEETFQEIDRLAEETIGGKTPSGEASGEDKSSFYSRWISSLCRIKSNSQNWLHSRTFGYNYERATKVYAELFKRYLYLMSLKSCVDELAADLRNGYDPYRSLHDRLEAQMQILETAKTQDVANVHDGHVIREINRGILNVKENLTAILNDNAETRNNKNWRRRLNATVELFGALEDLLDQESWADKRDDRQRRLDTLLTQLQKTLSKHAEVYGH